MSGMRNKTEAVIFIHDFYPFHSFMRHALKKAVLKREQPLLIQQPII